MLREREYTKMEFFWKRDKEKEGEGESARVVFVTLEKSGSVLHASHRLFARINVLPLSTDDL